MANYDPNAIVDDGSCVCTDPRFTGDNCDTCAANYVDNVTITFGIQRSGNCTDPSDKGVGTYVTDITECNKFGNWRTSTYARNYRDENGNYYLGEPNSQGWFQPGCTYVAEDPSIGGFKGWSLWNPRAGTPVCRPEPTHWTCVCKYTLTEKCSLCVDGYAMNDENVCTPVQ